MGPHQSKSESSNQRNKNATEQPNTSPSFLFGAPSENDFVGFNEDGYEENTSQNNMSGASFRNRPKIYNQNFGTSKQNAYNFMLLI